MRAGPLSTNLSVGIIGAGPGGLALGILLARADFHDFTIFDREDDVGGTWRINTYPGLACDVKSHLYSKAVSAVDGDAITAPDRSGR
jgi:cyclohexanone monooxygenase